MPTLRSCFLEAAGIVFVLFVIGVTSNLIAYEIEGVIAKHCAVDLQRLLNDQ